MHSNTNLKLTTGAMLIAIGIAIPIFSPFKIPLEPASFTLASHVAIFIAMMISPRVAAAVTVGTTIGFFFSSLPLVVTLRAASHIVFVMIGAYYLQKFPQTLESFKGRRLFSLGIGAIHGACEVIVCTVFYMGGNMTQVYYQKGFWYTVFLLVGVGSLIHSMVDFEIAMVVTKALNRQPSFAAMTHRAH